MIIGERGQITIPKALRERYGLFPHLHIEIVEEEGKLVLRRLTTPTTDPWQMVVGIIKDPHIDVDTEIEEMRGR